MNEHRKQRFLLFTIGIFVVMMLSLLPGVGPKKGGEGRRGSSQKICRLKTVKFSTASSLVTEPSEHSAGFDTGMAAARLWNEAAGYELFQPDLGRPYVTIRYASELPPTPEPRRRARETSAEGDPLREELSLLIGEYAGEFDTLGDLVVDRGKRSVVLMQKLEPEIAVAVVAHHLGHLLGLEHSEDPQSIMHPRLTSNNSAQAALSLADARRLEEGCKKKMVRR